MAMTFVSPHNMTKDDAKEWVNAQILDLLDEYGSLVYRVKYNWESYVMQFSFETALTRRIQGTLRVSADDYTVVFSGHFGEGLLDRMLISALEHRLKTQLD